MWPPRRNRWEIDTSAQPVAVCAADDVSVPLAGDFKGDRGGSEHAVCTPAASRTGRLAAAQFRFLRCTPPPNRGDELLLRLRCELVEDSNGVDIHESRSRP